MTNGQGGRERLSGELCCQELSEFQEKLLDIVARLARHLQRMSNARETELEGGKLGGDEPQ